jgi:hypothetical protein
VSNLITLKKLYTIGEPVITSVISDYELSDGSGYLNVNPSRFSVYSVSPVNSEISINFAGENYHTYEDMDNVFGDLHFFSRNKTFRKTSFNSGQTVILDKDPSTKLVSIGLCSTNKVGEYNFNKPGYIQIIGSVINVDPNFESHIVSGASIFSIPGLPVWSDDAFRLGPLPMLLVNSMGITGPLPFQTTCNLTATFNTLHNSAQVMSNLGVGPCKVNFKYFLDGPGIDLNLKNITVRMPVFYLNDTAHYLDIYPAKTVQVDFPGYQRLPLSVVNIGAKWNYTSFEDGSDCTLTHKICGGFGCVQNTTTIASQSVLFQNIPTSYLYQPYFKDGNFSKDFHYNLNSTGVRITDNSIVFNLTSNSAGNMPSACTTIKNPGNIMSISFYISENCTDGNKLRFWSSGDSNLIYSETPTCLNANRVQTSHEFSIVAKASSQLEFCVGAITTNLTGPQIITLSNYSQFIDDDNTTTLSVNYSITNNLDCLAIITPHHIQLTATPASDSTPNINVLGAMNNCTWLNTAQFAGEVTNTTFFREFKNGDDIILPMYQRLGENIDDIDPDYSFYGTIEIANDNYSSCPVIKDIKTDYKSKNKVRVGWTIENLCVEQNYTTFIAKNSEKFATNGYCTGVSSSLKCHQTLSLTTWDPVTINIVAYGDQYITKQYRVNYKWSECQTLCFWPVENLNIYWKTLIWSLAFIAVMFLLLTFTYPCFAVFMFCEKCFRFIWKFMCFAVLPFIWVFKKIWMIITSGVGRLRNSYSSNKTKNILNITPKQEDTTVIPAKTEQTKTIARNGNKMVFIAIIMLLPLAFACENEILGASNITSCINGNCDVVTDMIFTLPAVKNSQLCVEITSVDTNLGIEPISKEDIKITVKDFYLNYPIQFSYYSPWTSIFLQAVGCDCPDGSSHSCTPDHHPSGAGCVLDDFYCWYKASSGTGQNCEDELLFGDGHYCNSFSFTYDTLLAVGTINNSPTYHMYIEVCQGLDCETVWHNTTGQLTHQMFNNDVILTVGGFLVSSLPDFSGYSLIKTAGKSWVGRVNQLGDYSMSTPAFVQKWGAIGSETWHLSESNVNQATTIKHNKCYDKASSTVTYKIPVFSTWLTADKELTSYAGPYGQATSTGYGPGMDLTFRPNTGPTSLNQLTSLPGWVDIVIAAAFFVINIILVNCVYEVKILSIIIA